MAVATLQRIKNSDLNTLASVATTKLSPDTPFHFSGHVHCFTNSGSDDAASLEAIPWASKGDVAVNLAKISPNQRAWRLDDDDGGEHENWASVASEWQVNSDDPPSGGTDGDYGLVVNGFGYIEETGIYLFRYIWRKVDGTWTENWCNRQEFDRLLAALKVAIVAENEWDSLLSGEDFVVLHNSPDNQLEITTPKVSDSSMLLMSEITCIIEADGSPSMTREIIPYYAADLWLFGDQKFGWTMHDAPDGYAVTGKIVVMTVTPGAGFDWDYTTSDESIIEEVTVVWGAGVWTFFVEFGGSGDEGEWWIQFSLTDATVVSEVVGETASPWLFTVETAWSGSSASAKILFPGDDETWEEMEIPGSWISSPGSDGVNRGKILVSTTAMDRAVYYQGNSALFTTSVLSGVPDTSPDRYYWVGTSGTYFYKSVAVGGHALVGLPALPPGVIPYGVPCLNKNHARINFGTVNHSAYVHSVTLRRGSSKGFGRISDSASDLEVDVGWVDSEAGFHAVRTFTIPAGEIAITVECTLFVSLAETDYFSLAYDCSEDVLVTLAMRKVDGFPASRWLLAARDWSAYSGYIKSVDALSFNAIESRLSGLP